MAFTTALSNAATDSHGCFLVHQKSSFRSRDIQFFVIFPFPNFPDSKGQMEAE